MEAKTLETLCQCCLSYLYVKRECDKKNSNEPSCKHQPISYHLIRHTSVCLLVSTSHQKITDSNLAVLSYALSLRLLYQQQQQYPSSMILQKNLHNRKRTTGYQRLLTSQSPTTIITILAIYRLM